MWGKESGIQRIDTLLVKRMLLNQSDPSPIDCYWRKLVTAKALPADGKGSHQFSKPQKGEGRRPNLVNNFPRQGRPRMQPLEGKAGREVGFRSPSAWMASNGPYKPCEAQHM